MAIPKEHAKEGIPGSEPAEKARMLNEQFSSVFTRKDINNMDFGPSPFPKMSAIKMDEAVLLKTCAEEISPMLTFIFQQALDQSTVPDDWKIGLFTPL